MPFVKAHFRISFLEDSVLIPVSVGQAPLLNQEPIIQIYQIVLIYLVSHKIKLFHIDDESLKQLGELLSNQTSRTIIKALIEKEYYTNELSEKLNIPTSLVIHHLKKLEALNIVDIKQKQIVKKGVDRRFFRIRSDIFIKSTKENKKDTGGIKNIFKDGAKFCAIGIAAICSYFMVNYYQSTVETWYSAEGSTGIEYNYSIIIALVVIITGLIAERLYFRKIKNG